MVKNILFWLNNSRLFSLPMTIMSWVIIFVYGIKQGGDILNGILALVGISFAHLATNLFDDYVDYKALSKDKKFFENSVKTKCSYIKNGSATLSDVLRVVVVYCVIALLIGIILFFRRGVGVLWLAFLGGIITLAYPKLSSVGLSEVAVGTAFGPLLFEGVYYVMCGNFSGFVLLLSIATVVFTVGLLYTHTILDFDGDMCAEKKTLCCRIGDKNRALILLAVLYFIGYMMCFSLALFGKNLWYILPVITCPFAIMLYVLLKLYNNDKSFVPEIHWWYYPLDNWDAVEKEGTESFYLRLYQARNLMIWFSLLMLVAILMD